MFDEVIKRDGGKRAARKSAYLAGSTVFQVAFLAVLIFASEKIRAKLAEAPPVDVQFVKTKAAPPPAPPPPPPAPKRPKSAPKPPSDAPKPPPPPPQAMIQPKEVKEEIKLPDPNSKPEPEPDYGDENGSDDGVVGGVAGAQQAAPAAAAGGGIEEAPVYATAGFTQPKEKQRGCVSSSIRIPRDLQGIAKVVVAKFGIKPSGQPYAFSIVGPQPDPRIVQAVWNAIQQCDWAAGTDAQGRPVSIWVTLPLRFTAN